MQSSIAEAVVSALNVELTRDSRRAISQPPTANLVAYDFFLKANANGDVYAQSADQLRSSVRYLEAAVRLDPTFGLAWAQLAMARTYLSWFNFTVDSVLNAGAGHTVSQSIRLAPRLPEAWLASAVRDRLVEGDSVGAIRDLEAGLAVAPSDPELLAELAGLVFQPEGPDSAFGLITRALSLDPRSYRALARYWRLLMQSSRFNQARDVAEQAARLAPGSPDALWNLITSLLSVGDTAGARRLARATPAGPDSLALLFVTSDSKIWLRTPDQGATGPPAHSSRVRGRLTGMGVERCLRTSTEQ